MRGIDNYIAKKRRGHANRLRSLAVLLLLSAIVASSVVWGLRFVGMTMARNAEVGRYLPQTPPPAKNASGGGYI